MVKTGGPHLVLKCSWFKITVGPFAGRTMQWNNCVDQLSGPHLVLNHSWPAQLVNTVGPKSQLDHYHDCSEITVGPEHTWSKSTDGPLLGPSENKDQLISGTTVF